MDINIDDNITEQYCSTHPKYKVQLIQVKGFENNIADQKLFYCLQCANLDDNFHFQNYLPIQSIIQSEAKTILPKWPPVCETKLINQLIESLQSQNINHDQIIDEIINFYDNLRQDILKQIDIQQKEAIKNYKDHLQSINKDSLLNKYEEKSKVNELKSILSNPQTKTSEKERLYKKLLGEITSEKNEIITQLSIILNQSQIKLIVDNQKGENLKKQSLLSIKKVHTLSKISQNQLCQELIIIDDSFLLKLDGQKILKSNNTHQLQIMSSGINKYTRVVSDLIIKPDIKYIFRLQYLQEIDNNCCFIALRKNKQELESDADCYLKKVNQYLINSEKDNSREQKQQLLKGSGFRIENGGIIEMRVSLNESIVHLLDYPDYKNKIGLVNSKNKNQLYQDQRLYFGIAGDKSKVALIDSFIADKFDD